MEMDPIKAAWKQTAKIVTWEEYLRNRNESSRENGFKDAYEEYFSKLSKNLI